MSSKIATAEQKGTFGDRAHELYNRFRKGEVDQEVVLKVLQDLVESGPKWKEKDGTIYFTVISDGTIGEEWIRRLEKKGCFLSESVKQTLRSSEFKPTNGFEIKVAVMKLRGGVTTSVVRKAANRMSFITPNPEVACLIREKFSYEEMIDMGLDFIVAMHKPIFDKDGHPALLAVGTSGVEKLYAFDGDPEHQWLDGGGFAFECKRSPATY